MYMWFCFYWTNLSLATFSFLLHQRRQKCMQFRSYATFSLLNTSPFLSAGDTEGCHGQTTDYWYKSTFTGRCPPPQGLHKFKTQDGKICFITTISPQFLLHYLDSSVLLSREMSCSSLQSPYHVSGTLSFRFHRDVCSKSQACFRTWRTDMPAGWLHSTGCSPPYPTWNTTLKQRELKTGLNCFHNEHECFQGSGTIRK